MFQEDKTIGIGLTEPKPLEEWRLILLNAAQYLREHGWTQEQYGQAGGPACAFGAMMFGPTHHDKTSVGLASYKLEKFIRCDDIVFWNDAPVRTADEVIAAMEACARHIEE